jgi:membrane associated rhomboid family serine protease
MDSEPTPSPEPTRAASPLPTHEPLWTYVILGINGLLWLAMTLSGGSENLGVLVRFGAKVNVLIVLGEYWRFVAPIFLHIGFWHLALNAYALLIFGRDVEQLFGRARFLALYGLAGLAGSVASFLGNDAISAGASGAIFGLVGAMVMYLFTHRRNLGRWGRQRLSNLLVVVGLNLMWGFVATGIDIFGHIGGLLAGLLLGWAYCPRYQAVLPSLPWEPVGLVDAFSRRRAWLATAGVVTALYLLAWAGIIHWTAVYGGV